MPRKHAPLTVSVMARKTGVSVRTLHFYDEIGLLVPDRSAKGYRLYGQEHLLRLQQILIGRSFGQSLEDIRQSLDDPAFDEVDNLKRQRERLLYQIGETRQMIASIDAALDFLVSTKETDMNTRAMFDGFDPSKYEQEASDRWSKSEAWKQSSHKTKSYGKADWAAIKAEADAIYADAAQAMAADAPVDGDMARALVMRHRDHIERWFYVVSPQMHRALADLWESDDRFRQSIDTHSAGLTDWFASAVRASCTE